MPKPSRAVVASSRSGAAYNAHSYHTKVPPDAIRQLIRRHLPDGGTVGDAFCGSGTTGVAAALAEAALDPTRHYDVLLGDLSPYATSIAEALNSPPDADAFEAGARGMLNAAAAALDESWTTLHNDGRRGTILYTIWSESIVCPGCERQVRVWDVAVDHEHGGVRRNLRCECGTEFAKGSAARVTERFDDEFAGTTVVRPLREPVRIVYEVDGERFEKQPDATDIAKATAGPSQLPAPVTCPRLPMMNRDGAWGDLHRGGYHQGMTHVHHFYTWRNFVTVGHLWQEASATSTPDATRLLVSSYNLAHATLMSRLVFKRNNPRPVLTGYQTGTLYVSALPVEKNPLIGIERSKLGALLQAFALTRDRRGTVDVVTGPASEWSRLDRKLDYAFVDPPFGSNIPYAEANFIAEAWLGEFTDQALEATVSRAQGKSVDDYRDLLAASFDALKSRLSPSARMTVMFHSATSEPWAALTGALRDAGLRVEDVLLLDKRQGSFKQVRTTGAVQGDLLIEVARTRAVAARRARAVSSDAAAWLAAAVSESRDVDLSLTTRRRLFSSYVADLVAGGGAPPVSARAFYREVDALSARLVAAANPMTTNGPSATKTPAGT